LNRFETATPAQRVVRAHDNLRRLDGLCAAAEGLER
jgi:hypothetical protein